MLLTVIDPEPSSKIPFLGRSKNGFDAPKWTWYHRLLQQLCVRQLFDAIVLVSSTMINEQTEFPLLPAAIAIANAIHIHIVLTHYINWSRTMIWSFSFVKWTTIENGYDLWLWWLNCLRRSLKKKWKTIKHTMKLHSWKFHFRRITIYYYFIL